MTEVPAGPPDAQVVPRFTGVDEAIDRIRQRAGNRPVYVSVDIDVLDPAHAPGTGTPEPGGLTTTELQLILRGQAAPGAS